MNYFCSPWDFVIWKFHCNILCKYIQHISNRYYFFAITAIYIYEKFIKISFEIKIFETCIFHRYLMSLKKLFTSIAIVIGRGKMFACRWVGGWTDGLIFKYSNYIICHWRCAPLYIVLFCWTLSYSNLYCFCDELRYNIYTDSLLLIISLHETDGNSQKFQL